MVDMMKIGKNIRKYRKQKGLTQRTLAKEILVSYQAISAWERGQSAPDLANAACLAKYFGVSMDALVFGE